MFGLGSTGTVILIIVGLIGLVIIHEAGHFLAARAVGARATKFYVGFGPSLFHFRRGDTEYGFAAIPAGGYVKIPGMLRPAATDLYRLEDAGKELQERLQPDEPNVIDEARLRIARALTDADYDAAAREARATVPVLESVGDRLHPRTLTQARKEVERIADDAGKGAFWRLSTPRRIIVLAAGPAMNLLAAIVILSLHLMIGVPQYQTTTHVDAVVAASPAQASGLLAGDRIVAVDGRRAGSAADVSNAIQSAGRRSQAVQLTVLRDGAQVVLRSEAPKADSTGVPRLGLEFGLHRTGTTRVGPITATRRSVGVSWGIVRDSVTGLAGAFDGHRKNLGTVVGVVAEAQGPVQEGGGPEVFAFVSIALAVFNLLPFLPLDGGHILFAAIERLRRGRPIPRVAFERYSVFGIVLMLMVFAVGLSNDVSRMTGH